MCRAALGLRISRLWDLQVSASFSTDGLAERAQTETERATVPAESASSNSADDNLRNNVQQAAERVAGASHGPTTAAATLELSGGPG